MLYRIIITFALLFLISCSDNNPSNGSQAQRQQQHKSDESQHNDESLSEAKNQIKLNLIDIKRETKKVNRALEKKSFTAIPEHANKIQSLVTELRKQIMSLPNNDMPLYFSNQLLDVVENLEHEAEKKNDKEVHHNLEEIKELVSNLSNKLQ